MKRILLLVLLLSPALAVADKFNYCTGCIDFTSSSGGGGGSSSLQITQSGVQITSPTNSINLYGGDFGVTAIGTTSQIILNPSTTDFIHNQSTLQSSSFYVTSGTFNTEAHLHYLPSQSIVGTDATGNIVADPGGSGNYIHNQNSPFQHANATIDGFFNTSGGMISPIYYFGDSTLAATEDAIGGRYFGTGSLSAPPSVTGTFNTCTGAAECNGLTSGTQNSCYGYQACNKLTQGSENIYIGSSAGTNATVGNNNVAIGNAAGGSQTTSNYNTLIGNGAGDDFTTGVENTCIGDTSCNDITTGSSNTAVGFGTVNNAGANVGMTYIGAQAGAAGVINTLTMGTALGYGATVSSSFTMVLGAIGTVNSEEVLGSTFSFSSGTVTGQLLVGTVQGGGLSACGDSTHALNWSGGTFGCQSITSSGGSGIVSPGTFTWVNNFGAQWSTGTFINATSMTTLSVSTSATGVSQLAISSTIATAPTDPLLSISSAPGTIILWINNAGNLISSGTTTTVTSCGSSPSVLGNNISGTITVGGGVVTSCTLNFANGGFVNAPVCIPSDNSSTVSVSNGATTATSAVFNTSATLGGGLINYICIGYQK